jgi:predicted DsbA family dithiol-disulfide isomerase
MNAQTQESSSPFRVVVFADFVCPYSFLAVEQIDRIAREYEVQAIWRPHWLHPETPPEGTPREPAEAAARLERLQAWVKEMAPEHYPRMRIPNRRHYSFLAFEALEFADDRGLGMPFKTAVFDTLWTEEADIGRPETLMAAAERVGLDPAELGVALRDRLYAERALEAVNQAREIGIMNTPTIFLGKTRINGWTYYEVLESVLEKQGMRPRSGLTSASQAASGTAP